MKRMLVLLAVLTVVLVAPAALAVEAASSADEELSYDYAEYEFERWYVDCGAAMMLPQGGAKLSRRSGAMARLGYYCGDFLAVEGTAAWLEDEVGFGLHGLWHWWGYEKFDPFFTFGANGWIEGAVGPAAGVGFFWHFNDVWSLRFDGDSTLNLEGDAAMVYQLSLAIQLAF